MLTDAADHLTVDERMRRRAVERYLEAAIVLLEADLEVAIGFEQRARIVRVGARVEHRQHALPQHGIQATRSCVAELLHLELGQDLEAALGPHVGADRFAGIDVQRCSPAIVHRGYAPRGHRPSDYGRISIGVLSPVISQISIMSELDTAMQPLVQSWVR